MKSRNFTLEEIAHRPLPNDKRDIAAFLTGKMQSIVDYLSYQLKTRIGCTPTSGYRSPKVNIDISTTDRADKTSNHMWRIENDYIKCAGDYKFFNKQTSIQIPCSIIFPLLAPFGGEIYWNKKEDIIHIADQGFNEPHWIQ